MFFYPVEVVYGNANESGCAPAMICWQDRSSLSASVHLGFYISFNGLFLA